MVDLCPKQVDDLRKDIKDRYGLDINARITRVEFEEQGRNRVYFRAEDGYKPPKQAEPPETLYTVFVWENSEAEEPQSMQFRSLSAAMIAFRNMQHFDYAQVVMKENDTVLQTYEGKTEKIVNL